MKCYSSIQEIYVTHSYFTSFNPGICNQNGTCTCKSLVTGSSCERCKDGSYELSALKSEGCTRCNCSAKGTTSGDTISQGMKSVVIK